MNLTPIPPAQGSTTEYARVHYAARKRLALAGCAHCDNAEGALHAALILSGARPSDLRVALPSSTLYSVSLEDYVALCIPCHRRLDFVEGRPACKHGHPFSPENTLFRPNGSRRCRTCNRLCVAAANATPEGRARKAKSDRESRKRHPMSAAAKARKLELQRLRRIAQLSNRTRL